MSEQHTFYVQYEEGGRVYTYDSWTLADLTAFINRRHQARGELPYRIWTDQGEININMDRP